MVGRVGGGFVGYYGDACWEEVASWPVGRFGAELVKNGMSTI